MVEEKDYTSDEVMESLMGEQPEMDSTGDDTETSKEANQEAESQDGYSMLDEYSEEKKEGGGTLLDELNALGIIREGLPVEFDDLDKVKEYLSKGFDYTAKTQELSNARKQQEEELTAKMSEFENTRVQFEQERQQFETELLENQVIGEVVSNLQKTDPEIFEILRDAFTQRMSMYQASVNSPAFNKVNSKVSELENSLKELKGSKEQEKVAGISKDWENGISQVQTEWGGKLKSLGIKPSPKDWERVKSVWGSDASNSLSVKDAFWAVMGESIRAALESKGKLAETKAKSIRRAPVANSKPQHQGLVDIDAQINEIIEKHGF